MSVNRYNHEGYPDPTAYEALAHLEIENRKSSYRPIVYICSPFSGNTEENAQTARRYSRFAVDRGFLPIAPHLLFPQFMDDDAPDERKLAMRMNLILLSKCAELWVFGERVSEGMAIEIAQGKHKDKPVRYFTDQCEEVFR